MPPMPLANSPSFSAPIPPRARRLALLLTALLPTLILGGCAHLPGSRAAATAAAESAAPLATPAPPPAASLYERLGGATAIGAVVDEMLARTVADPLVGPRFEGANVPRLRKTLVEQIGAATGGPEVYTGGDMRTVHAGMGIDDKEFDAVAGALAGALDRLGIPEQEKTELLTAIGSMRGDIVAVPPTVEQRLESMEKSLMRMEKGIARLVQLQTTAATTGARAASVSASARPASASASASAPAATKENFEKQRATIGAQPPAKGQPWTPEEKATAEKLVERYATTSTAGEKTSGESREDLLGMPLDPTRFLAADGSVLDVESLRGKKLVVVVLRGFSKTVCIHCSTQLLALGDNKAKLAGAGAEVLVVYPGEANTVPTFLNSTRALRKDAELPFNLLLDVDLAAVRRLGLEGSLARPTTLLLDADGVVRWVHVGRQPADRPSVETILAELAKI